MPRFAPRIHVLLARDAPLGLVFRRGPSNSVATLLWDRRCDEFQVGQWLNGRIYVRRCDLSPDGRHLIYFAMNAKWTSESRGAWTAISRAPYLKAIAFFPKGDCWNGGGLWTGQNTYWLNDGYGHRISHDTTEVYRDQSYQLPCSYGGECPGVYYHRLIRDGWILNDHLRTKWMDRDVFDKNLGNGWTLRKIAHADTGPPPGKGCYWDEHELIGPGDKTIACPTWEWAELNRDRLVWATNGKLFAAEIQRDGLADPVELYDFNDMTFEAIEAPY
jgi:hypothetical protein